MLGDDTHTLRGPQTRSPGTDFPCLQEWLSCLQKWSGAKDYDSLSPLSECLNTAPRGVLCGFVPSWGCRRLSNIAHEVLHLVLAHLEVLSSLGWPSSPLYLLPHPSPREYFLPWKQPSTFLSTFKNIFSGTSLVVQWLRIHLSMQGARVRALVREDRICRRATKPVRHNYWACALESTSHNCWAYKPQLLKPTHLEPVLHNKRSHRNEKTAHCNKEQLPLAATRESPHAATKTQCSQK